MQVKHVGPPLQFGNGTPVHCYDCGRAYSIVNPALHKNAGWPEPQDLVCGDCLFGRNFARMPMRSLLGFVILATM